MAASMSIEQSGMDGRMMLNPGTGIAFDIEISECVTSGSPVPKRVRRRLVETMESKSKYPASLEGIESRLKEADLRRQQFHEWLANKARSRPRTSPRSPQYEDLAQRLEAKLSAAEQKRAELLAQEQMRLAKLHELRVAAKTEAQLRSEREREELGCKVELRVLQAENKRLALLEAEKQRHAAAHERIAQSVMHRTHQEGKDRERIEALRVAICKRIAAAEEKRAGLLRAEKNRAQASVLQARLVAKAVVRERELELRKKKEKLEDRLQRARRQRAEFLRQRGGCRGVCHNQGHKLHKHGDRLCRKLTRCWRQFRRSRRTTYSLAQDYVACAINVESVTSIAFEQLAARITSPLTLRTVKALLGRIESRLVLSLAGHATKAAQIDHLLKHLSPPSRRTGASVASVSGKKLTPQGGYKGVAKDAGRSPAGTATVSTGKDVPTSEEKDKDRYPARVFLCAYMIQGQPDAVFSSRGKRETALAAAAARLLPEFEALTTTILNGPSTTPLCPSSPNSTAEKSSDWSPDGPASTPVQPPQFRPFAAQLAAFDSAWCSYLYQFVAWKVKDAQVLEADLTRMACQLELSMLQKCKVLPDGNPSELSHDAKAIRKQVFEDQNLLRDRIVHLTGSAGLVRLENALVDTRVKFEDAIRNGLPLPSPFASPVLSKSYSTMPNLPVSASPGGNSQESHNDAGQTSQSKAVRSLFPSVPETGDTVSSSGDTTKDAQVLFGDATRVQDTGFSNERIVNEMLHDSSQQFLSAMTQHKPLHPDYLSSPLPANISNMQAQVRATMENAFWDSIAEDLMKVPTGYKRIVSLVGEVRDELEVLVPEEWKMELHESMDLELFSQILESGSSNIEYLRQLLDYAASLILKLGAPIRDSDAKAAHQSLVDELSIAVSPNSESESAFAVSLVKGVRFIFEQIQVLKQDITSTRLQALAPLINGPAGIDYMRKAFGARFQLKEAISVAEITQHLPRTFHWFEEVAHSLEREQSELESSLAAQHTVYQTASRVGSQVTGLPPVSSMRTGGQMFITTGHSGNNFQLPSSTPQGQEILQREFAWKSSHTMVRLGLLHILSSNEAATEKNVPETLVLSASRLQDCQNALQRILVIATGLLVARQGLVGQGIVGSVLEKEIESGRGRLDNLLNKPTATIAEIGFLLAQIANGGMEEAEASANLAAKTELMTRVLGKSLSPEDAVFARVSAAVGASLRSLLILGKGAEAVAIAELALRRIGGSCLMEKLVTLVDAVDRLAAVTSRIHEPWYDAIAAAVLSTKP